MCLRQVLLYVYDLSNGFARLMSQSLLGKQVRSPPVSLCTPWKSYEVGYTIYEATPYMTPWSNSVADVRCAAALLRGWRCKNVPCAMHSLMASGTRPSSWAAWRRSSATASSAPCLAPRRTAPPCKSSRLGA